MADYSNVWRNYFVNQNTTNDETAKKFLGSNFDYLQNNLKQSAEGNDPLFDRLFGNAARKIGASTDRNIQDIKEAGAQSGFRGAGGNLINDAYKGEQESLAGVSDNLAVQESNYKQNAISKLLGLNQFEGGQFQNLFQSDRQNMQFREGLDENRRQFNEQMAKEPSWWESLLGGLLGAGGQIGAAVLSDKKLKKNIKKVGESKDGIPIHEFEYKKKPGVRIRGVLSQEVKKKIPDAVYEMIDYKKLPKDIPFEVVE